MTASRGVQVCKFCNRRADSKSPHYDGCPKVDQGDKWFISEFNKGYRYASGLSEWWPYHFSWLYLQLDKGRYSDSYVMGYEARVREVAGEVKLKAYIQVALDQM